MAAEPGELRAGSGETARGEVYISGALSSLGDAVLGRLFYELLAEIVGDAGFAGYVPHRHTDPVRAPALSPQDIYEIDRRHVSAARLLVAYAGQPSFGVGIEVELAREHGVPVVLVVERDRPVSRILLGNPAVVEVVRFSDLAELRRSLRDAVKRVTEEAAASRPEGASFDDVVQRFLRTLAEARRLPAAEVSALLRLGGLEGQLADDVRRAVADDRLFAAGLRDLVGRHGLRGEDLALFLARYVLGRSLSAAQRRRLEAVLARLGLGADEAVVAQWLVTELVAPPSRTLQLQLFGAAAGDT